MMRKKRTQDESAAPQLEPRRVTPVEIQQKEFRLAMRGYNERDVDLFLDEVTEEVARLYADNKRLREEVEFGKTTRLETTGAAEAEGVMRQAREEAARIIAEATARASTMGGGAGAVQASGDPAPVAAAPPSEIMSIFLARERAFLQNMANLIQAHAEGVKQDVRRVREHVDRPIPPTPAPEPQASPATDSAEAVADDFAERGEQGPRDEPTQSWEPPSESRPEGNSSPRDLVDLTHQEGEAAEEPVADAPTNARSDTGGSPGASGGEGALSAVYGRTPLQDGGESFSHGEERRPGGNSSPKVDEDDAREDRSIRELFWGED
jgi:DivIVA domain-containing protein